MIYRSTVLRIQRNLTCWCYQNSHATKSTPELYNHLQQCYRFETYNHVVVTIQRVRI